MSSVKKNQQDYEALLKNYERAQAQFSRTQLIEKAAKKSLKKAVKGDASKAEVEVLRLELDIAKAKRKARKAGATIAKTYIKQWIKTNAKSKKSYKLTIQAEEPMPKLVIDEPSEEVMTKRPYKRRAKVSAEDMAHIEEGKAGKSILKEDIQEEIAEEKKTRQPRRSKEEIKAEKEAAQAALIAGGENFTIIEGVGPAVTILLHKLGVSTFANLAAADADALKEQLRANGNKISDPTSWAEQAQLVLDNNWEALKELQATLKKPRS